MEPRERTGPQIPPTGQLLRLLMDSDRKNEINDQWAIALASLSPERFRIEGFAGRNFDHPGRWGGASSMEVSAREIESGNTCLARSSFAELRSPHGQGHDLDRK